VVIAPGGDKDRLGPSLASVLENSGWLDFDAVVVHDGEDYIPEYVEERFLDVRTLRCADRGLGHAYNRALETANARYLLFLSADLQVSEGTLATLVAALDRRPEVALAGVRQLNSDGSLAPSIRRFPSTRHMLAEALGLDRVPGAKRVLGEYELDARKYEETTACDWTSGFIIVRHAALETIGWFDERLRPGAGEADLCLRLKRGGWGVVSTPSLTVQRSKSNRLESGRLEAQAAYARMQFARKHSPRTAADYRWALALRYALRVGFYSLLGRYEHGRRQAARAALATVLRGEAPAV